MTERRDRVPKDLPTEYLVHGKVPVSDRTCASWFLHPIVSVKDVPGQETNELDEPKKPYQLCHVSFQSTGATNFSTVNALNSVERYIRKKERGRGDNKRTWGIEMNDARELYLKTYCRIDRMDHLMVDTDMKSTCWKYWHAPMLHAKKMAIVVTHDMYLELAGGKFNPD